MASARRIQSVESRPIVVSAKKMALAKLQAPIWHRAVVSLTALLTLSAVPSKAGPMAPLRDATHEQSKKTIDVWRVKQSNCFGTYTVYAAPKFLRIDCSSGGSLIAKAPDWKICLFHIKDGRGCEIPYKHWALNRNANSFNIEHSQQRASACKVAGIDAKRYTFPLENFKAEEDGGLYRSIKRKEFVRSAISVAADAHGLPHEPIEIWRLLLEVQTRFSIPLEIRNDERFGGSSYSLETKEGLASKVPVSFFEAPTGLKNEGTPITIFYGSGMEDAAKMMIEMK